MTKTAEERAIFNLRGVTCKVGDIIESLNIPFKDHAERYHIVLDGGETRDLGNNNKDMWMFWGPIKNLGHYSNHPDLFDDEDLEHYFPKEFLAKKQHNKC